MRSLSKLMGEAVHVLNADSVPSSNGDIAGEAQFPAGGEYDDITERSRCRGSDARSVELLSDL